MAKKNQLNKKKSLEQNNFTQQIAEYKDLVAKLTRENAGLKKKAEENQEMANKLYILESQIHHTQEERDEANESYRIEDELEDLREELEHKQFEIEDLKEAHMR